MEGLGDGVWDIVGSGDGDTVASYSLSSLARSGVTGWAINVPVS